MLSLHGDIFLKVPLDIEVNKYLGFTPMNSWESALLNANPKYLFTCYQASRYHREEITLPDNSRSSQGRPNKRLALSPRILFFAAWEIGSPRMAVMFSATSVIAGQSDPKITLSSNFSKAGK